MRTLLRIILLGVIHQTVFKLFVAASQNGLSRFDSNTARVDFVMQEVTLGQA
jgi:hypothetical protein